MQIAKDVGEELMYEQCGGSLARPKLGVLEDSLGARVWPFRIPHTHEARVDIWPEFQVLFACWSATSLLLPTYEMNTR